MNETAPRGVTVLRREGRQAGNPQHIGTSEVDEGGGAAVEVWEDPGG